jgi:hypothetical protein
VETLALNADQDFTPLYAYAQIVQQGQVQVRQRRIFGEAEVPSALCWKACRRFSSKSGKMSGSGDAPRSLNRFSQRETK